MRLGFTEFGWGLQLAVNGAFAVLLVTPSPDGPQSTDEHHKLPIDSSQLADLRGQIDVALTRLASQR